MANLYSFIESFNFRNKEGFDFLTYKNKLNQSENFIIRKGILKFITMDEENCLLAGFILSNVFLPWPLPERQAMV